MATLLQQAIDLAKAGNRQEAETVLHRVLADQPNNEVAWIWLSGVTRDKAVKVDALQKALALNPTNNLAKEGITRFGGTLSSAITSETEVPLTSPVLEEPPEVGEVDIESSFLAELTDDEPELPAFEPVADTPEPDSSLKVDADDSSDFGDFNFTFDDELDLTTDTAESTSETPADDAPFDWGTFDFEGDTPFNFDLDAPAETKSQEPTATDSGAFDFDFGDTSPPDLQPTASEPAASQSDDPFTNLFGDETAAESDTTFSWDDAPDFNFAEPETTATPTEEADAGVDIIARLGPAEATSNSEASIEASVDADSDSDFNFDVFDEPDLKFDDSDPKTVLKSTAIAKQKQQEQQGTLILVVALIILLVVLGAAMWVFDDVVGRYTVIPAPSELTRNADRPNSAGVSTVNFNGFPADRVRIQWARNNEAETCVTPGIGLAIDLGEAQPSIISNQVCSGDTCLFEKTDLTGVAQTQITIQYQCGSNAVITMFNDGP